MPTISDLLAEQHGCDVVTEDSIDSNHIAVRMGNSAVHVHVLGVDDDAYDETSADCEIRYGDEVIGRFFGSDNALAAARLIVRIAHSANEQQQKNRDQAAWTRGALAEIVADLTDGDDPGSALAIAQSALRRLDADG